MPNNWKTYKLEEISTNVAYGYTASASIENVGPKFLRITDIQDNFIDWKSVPFCKIKENDFIKNKLEIGDIVVARTGNSTGATACMKDEIDAVFASYLIRFRIDKKIANPFYVDYILRSQNWKNYVEAVKGGSAQPGANAKQFGAFELELPPLQEQQSIAAILSAIDDKIENNLAINKTLEEMAMALYKHWFVDFGPFQDGEFVESELGMIPKGWEVKRLDEIITVKRGGSPRPIQDFLAETGLPWVKISDATASSSPYLMETKEFIKEEGLRKTVLLKKGSLILSNSASPGIPKFLELDACIHDGWLHFPEINRFGKYLLYLTFIRIKEELIQKGNGSVFTNLKTDILKSQLVTLPPLEIEQKINDQIRGYFKLIKNNCKENQTLTQLRDTLLPKLISGEVRLKEFRE